MGKVSSLVTKADRCDICHKREAVKLCDVIIGHQRMFDYPTKGNIIDEDITCDKKLCIECSIRITEYMDICPNCWNDRLKGGEVKCQK